MNFNVAVSAYDACMGRYSMQLVGQMKDLADIPDRGREALARPFCASLPTEPFTIEARAWAARGRVAPVP